MAALRNPEITVPFLNGEIELFNSGKKAFKWRCETSGAVQVPKVKEEAVSGHFTLDLKGSAGYRCHLEIPEGATVVLDGKNGSLTASTPHFNLTARLENGEIAFLPDPGSKYRFQNSVVNGQNQPFESSDALEAYKISLSTVNGSIGNH